MSTSNPILFLIFNRPDVTFQVFNAIRSARPARLYVAADGPRSERIGEAELCEMARKIATNVDWPCDVKTYFRDNNAGCKMNVSEAIGWFFKNETQGIILEDDILPNESFFKFIDDALDRYKDDESIGMVCGYNPLGTYGNTPFSAAYPHIWGWGTWRRVWTKYKVQVPDDAGLIYKIIYGHTKSRRAAKSLSRLANKIRGEIINTWDMQLGFCACKYGLYSIYPHKNSVLNIGFGSEATHTKYGTSKEANLELEGFIDFSNIKKESNFDRIRFAYEYPNIFIRIYKYLKLRFL